MEDVETTNKVVKNGFINHVFNFDNETKTEALNVGQYLLLAIVPMAFYNYMVDSVIPEVDESKSNLEILAEVVGQLSLVLVGMFFIHRLITFVPTYSGRAMGDMNLFSIILLILVLLYESHTKVGEKTYKAFPNLEWIIVRQHGFDNVNLAECEKRGIGVVNTKPFAQSTANWINQYDECLHDEDGVFEEYSPEPFTLKIIEKVYENKNNK